MNITPKPTLTMIDFTPEDHLYRVEVDSEKVVDFSASRGWIITNVSITNDHNVLTLTVEKGENNECNIEI